jgi:hypothetical protein
VTTERTLEKMGVGGVLVYIAAWNTDQRWIPEVLM